MDYDYVKCCNCMEITHVEPGEEQCPHCKFVGALTWYEDEQIEGKGYEIL